MFGPCWLKYAPVSELLMSHANYVMCSKYYVFDDTPSLLQHSNRLASKSAL